MTIDVKTLPPEDGTVSELGAGYWLKRLSDELHDEKRKARLELLDAWYRCDPPLPNVTAHAQNAYRMFVKLTRSNFCALIPEATRERMLVRGIRTSSDGDATGDAEAWRIWRRARMTLAAAEVHRLMLRFGTSYALVSPASPRTGVPVVTAEDPRYVVSEQDPTEPWVSLAGLKVFRDAVAGRDYAYLYRPGRVDVAFKETKSRGKDGPSRFSADSWSWDEEKTRDLPGGLMPLVRFANLDEQAEFEPHLDLLARINYMVLQRMMIATLQAFKQRAIKGVPVRDDKGQEIDYNAIFTSDPDSLWVLPATAELWESGQVDLGGILSAVKADVQHLAAVSRTTLSMFAPEGENQSAEGAASAKEGLIFKTEDRIDRVTPCWSEVMRACFLWLGDDERADLNGIDVIWAPPQRASLAERASSLAQAKAGDVPFRTRMIEFGGFGPEQVDRMEQERLDDALFLQILAAQQAATAQPVPSGSEGQTEAEPADEEGEEPASGAA